MEEYFIHQGKWAAAGSATLQAYHQYTGDRQVQQGLTFSSCCRFAEVVLIAMQ